MTPSRLVLIIVLGTQSLLAMACVFTICYSVMYKAWGDPTTLSALIVLTGTLVGNLGSILGGPRSMQQTTTTTETTPSPVPEAPQPEAKQP